MSKSVVAATLGVLASLTANYAVAADPSSQPLDGSQQGESGPTTSQDANAATQAPAAAPASADSQPGNAASQPQPSEAAATPTAAETPVPQATAPAASSPAPSSDAAPVTTIETVVVTARRTQESQQTVPVAITAFSANDLQKDQINSGQDLAGRIPSLNINSNSSTRNTETPTIRGQGATFGASPGVIIYYDEVPLPDDQVSNGQGGPGKFFDLANLQVLKGSQGTLFGRNTTGGALVLEPHRPGTEFEGSLHGEYANLNGEGLEGILNVPIVDDKLLLRVGAQFYERDGFTKDIASGQDLDNKSFRTMRMGLLWKPVDSFENYLLAYYTHSSDNGTSQVLEQINRGVVFEIPFLGQTVPLNVGCTIVALSGGTYQDCGRSQIAAQQARGIRNVDLSTAPDDLLTTQAVIDKMSYTLNDELTLRNIFSYSLYKHSFAWDTDGSILTIDAVTTPPDMNGTNTSTYTEEAQVQGSFFNSRLKLVAGGYFEYLSPNGPQGEHAVSFGITHTIQQYQVDHRSYGPYAQATYDLGHLVPILDGLHLTAGGRYTQDEQSGEASTGTYVNGNLVTGGESHSAQVKSDAPTYTFGLDYKVPTTLLYAKVSRGYKSGGFADIAVNPAHYTFAPEYVLNYEIGHKSDFKIGEMPVRIDSAIYDTLYSNMQRTSGDTFTPAGSAVPEFGGATYNAGKAEVMGFETDLTVRPFRRLTVSANYSYTYGKYKSFDLVYNSAFNVPLADCDGKTVTNGQIMNLNCVPFQYTPRHQASTTVDYRLPMEETLGILDATVTYSFIDSQYSSATSIPSEEPGAYLGAYGLLSASLMLSNIHQSAFDLQLVGANLTDRTYRITNSNVWNVFFYQSSIYGEPRTFGLQMTYHWGT